MYADHQNSVMVPCYILKLALVNVGLIWKNECLARFVWLSLLYLVRQFAVTALLIILPFHFTINYK